MPRKPKKPCSFPGCPNLTDERYCEKHSKLENKNYNQYQRNPITKGRYGNHWKRIRDAFVKEHPYCELCKKDGVFNPTEQVHHILPIAEGGSNEWNNLIALCKYHHSQLHAIRGDRWNNKKTYNY